MMRTLFFFLVVIILSVAFCAETHAAKMPIIKTPNCAHPPQLDGELSDPCWKNAYKSSTFYDFKLKSIEFKPNKETTLYLTADKTYLYAGVKCKHPTPKDMSIEQKENFSRIFGDESVKFFINPGLADNKFFRFVVNPTNCYTFNNSFIVPDMSWPTATKITDEGWNLEVAIPLFYLASYGDIRKLKMNVFRKSIKKDYDNQGVQVGLFTKVSTWCPSDVWIIPEKMADITNLCSNGLEIPFMVSTNGTKVKSFRYKDGKPFYDVTMELRSMTNTSGKVVVSVKETLSDGKQNIIRREFALKGKEIKRVNIEIPVAKLGQRTVNVMVKNAITNMIMNTCRINDTSALEMLSGYSKLNYYTSEKNAQIVYKLGLPREELKGMLLKVTDTSGTVLASHESPSPKGLLPLPVKKLRKGSNRLYLILASDNKKLFTEKIELSRLDPKPGCEVKIDREYGFFIKNGKPYFPYGFCAEAYDNSLKQIADAGFNSIIYWKGGPTDVKELVDKVGQYGLDIIVRAHCLEKFHPEKLETIKKYIVPKDLKKACYLCRHPIRIKLMNTGPFKTLSRQQKNEIGAEYFDYHLPAILKNVNSIKDCSNLLGYKTIDEPLFNSWDLHKELRKLYLAYKKVDPYHPMFVLYSSRIPSQPYATSCADSLGTDPYWTPGRKGQRGSIDWVSIVTARTVQRARRDHMVPWIAPEASWWSDSRKRALTGKEQICQSYLTLIHGSKGIFTWVWSLIAHIEQWNAFQNLAEQYKKLAPAIVAPDVSQQVSYSSGLCDPVKGILPEIQINLFRFPGGKYLLLAANSKYYPVETKFTIKGISDASVKRLFSKKTCLVEQNTFADKLEAMGVRAYQIETISQLDPVKIHVEMNPQRDDWKPEFSWDAEGRKGMKNIIPNPSFEEAALVNWPDYFKPLRRPRPEGYPRIGSPEATFTQSSNKPYHGNKCLLVDNRIFYIKFAPQNNSPMYYTMSFYARTNSKKTIEMEAYLLDGRSKKNMNFKITGSDWKRYTASIKIPPKLNTHSALFFNVKEGKVFIDALQFEKGMQATEFQP